MRGSLLPLQHVGLAATKVVVAFLPRCWLRVGTHRYANGTKHCYRVATVEYHGVMVCRLHAAYLVANGPQEVYAQV